MIFKPWDCAQPDEWLPQSLRLCWGSGDSDGGPGGGNTGGGDWGSAGSYDASGFDAGGIGAWGGSAYDASVFGTGMGGGGDWGSFGDTNYASFNAPNPSFEDVGGPNAGVTTGGGDWGSAGAFSAAGTGGGPGGAMFGAASGAAQGAGGGFWGGDTGGGVFGDYGGGGGGGGYYGGGGQQGGGGSFGGFGSGTLGGSNAIAAAPTGPTGSAFADSYGGGSLAGPAGQASSGAPTTSEAQSESADTSEGEAAPTDDAAPAVEATIAGGRETDFGAPAQSEAAPEDEAAPAQDSFASRFDAVAPAQQDSFASRFDAATPNAEPSAFGPQSLDQQSAGEQGKAGQQQDSFDSRFGFDTSAPTPSIEATIPGGQQTDFDYGPGQQTAAPDFNQAFEALNAPGWNPSEQTDGRTGLAEPTDWAGNPYEASTDVSVGRDFNQVFADVNGQLTNYEGAPYADMGPPSPGPDFDTSFQAFDTPTGMDLAGDFATGRTTDLSNQLGLQDLTVGPGLPTGPAFGISGLNLNPLTHDTDQAINVEIVPADQVPAPPPPEVQPPPPPDQPQALPEVQVQPTPEAQPAPQTPQEATPQAAPQAPPEAPQTPPQEAAPAPPPGLVTMLPPPALTPPFQPPGGPTPETRPAETPSESGRPDEHDDAPEPQDTSQPPQDPNAPRPPGNIPGQVTGARGTYTNSNLDNPRVNSNYRDSGRTDYPQGRPGITFRTARQAGVEPLFRTEDINVRDVDARLIENINRAIQNMPANIRDTLVATSGWRPAHRGEAHEHGQDERTSQESVYTRYNPNGRNVGPAAQPGRSNHGPGRALDFAASPARTWLRAHAGEYGLETLGRNFDLPHIQLQRGQGGQRPSAQEQAEQRAIDAQNRQAAIDRGLISPGGRGNQQAGVPMPRGRPSDAPQAEVAQPDVARPPAEIPAPTPPVTNLPPADRPPVDIPAPTLTPPARGRADPAVQTRYANNIIKDATSKLNKSSGEAEFQAASIVAAKAMAAAGIPLAVARSQLTKSAYEGAESVGYGPSSMGWNAIYKGRIDGGIATALQGYQPAKSGAVQGPPAPEASLRGLAKGGHVAKDEPVVVGEEGPEYFMPDRPGTVVPHMPQPGGPEGNIDRWPKGPATGYPGRYGGIERESRYQTRAAQDPVPSLIDLIDSGRLPLNDANWQRLINNPSLIALGQSRMGTVDAPAPEPAAEPPDPTNPMAQALGYGSIKRRPMQIGRQIY